MLFACHVVGHSASDGACDIVLAVEEHGFVVLVVDEGDLDEGGRCIGVFQHVEACFFDTAVDGVDGTDELVLDTGGEMFACLRAVVGERLCSAGALVGGVAMDGDEEVCAPVVGSMADDGEVFFLHGQDGAACFRQIVGDRCHHAGGVGGFGDARADSARVACGAVSAVDTDFHGHSSFVRVSVRFAAPM